MIDDGDPKTAFGNIEISPGEWVYLTAVYQRGANLTTYVNGEPDASVEISNNAYDGNNLPFQMGYVFNALEDLYFGGSMDNVMIFQKALSEEQVKGIYNNQKTFS